MSIDLDTGEIAGEGTDSGVSGSSVGIAAMSRERAWIMTGIAVRSRENSRE